MLDTIDNAIERTEAAIGDTERLRDALLHELLTHGVPGWHSEWRDVPGSRRRADVVWRIDAVEEMCAHLSEYGDWIELKDQARTFDYRIYYATVRISDLGEFDRNLRTFRWITR